MISFFFCPHFDQSTDVLTKSEAVFNVATFVMAVARPLMIAHYMRKYNAYALLAATPLVMFILSTVIHFG